ncbi:unnamed protein product [Urochloa decumbens]|uniref:Uncharacterized protein n=1 Tax=Urochloa decumbens TaxID=240449 RepID=A0ABC9BVH0_9POAL
MEVEAATTLAANSSDATMLIALAAVLLVLTLSVAKMNNNGGKLPPSPRALPLIGHLHLISPPPHQAFHRLVARHGPLVYLRMGPSNHGVVVGSADAARDLLKLESCLPQRTHSAVTRLLAYGSAGFAFAPYGAQWRFMKRLCMSELLGPRTLDLLRPVRDGELAAVLREAAAAAATAERGVDLSRLLIAMANNAVMRMTASALPDHLTETARHCAKEVTELVGSFNIADYIAFLRPFDLQGLDRRAHAVHAKFDALLEVLIRKKEEARRSPTPAEAEAGAEKAKDLLDILMDAAEDENAEVKLNRENIKAFVLDIFTAGSDTTATTVEWMLAELINHPPCLAKLRAELDAVIGRSRLVGEQDVERLPYLQAVLKETLRLHPPAVFAVRETIDTVHVRGYVIPPGTTVFFSIYSVGRDPAVWERPLEFDPERFMPGGASEGVEVNAQSMQFMPFGGGRRACPGLGYAVQVVPAFLAALVQCFDWAVPVEQGQGQDAKAVPPLLNMDEKKGLVSARLQPLVLVPTPRIHPIPMPSSLIK